MMHLDEKRLFALFMLILSTAITAADVNWESDNDTENTIVEYEDSPYILSIKLPNATQLMFKVPYSRLEQLRGMLINFANLPDRGRNFASAMLYSLSDQAAGPKISFPVYLLEDLIQGLTALSFSNT